MWILLRIMLSPLKNNVDLRKIIYRLWDLNCGDKVVYVESTPLITVVGRPKLALLVRK